MTLKEQILAVDNYCLIKSCNDFAETTRAVYELALIHEGKPIDYKESPPKMIIRAMLFRIMYEHCLGLIYEDMLEEFGLDESASGAPDWSAAKHLSLGQVRRLFNMNMALYEALLLKLHIKQTAVKWCKSKNISET